MPPKRSRASTSTSSEPIDAQIAEWLYDGVAVTRWNKMKNSRIFEHSFVDFQSIQAYNIQSLTDQANLTSLLDVRRNDHPINHIMVKLFYANLNLGHQNPRNPNDSVWSMVCGKKVWFSLDRIAHILGSPNLGRKLEEIEFNPQIRDNINHLFLDDIINIHDFKSTTLRPRARLLHKALMRTITPRTGSYEIVYPNNYRALYAIWGNIQVNWVQLILDEFLTFNNSKMKTIYFGEYIMRLLLNVDTPIPESENTKVHQINHRTISLMQLPSRPPRIISLAEWESRQQQQHQPPSYQPPTHQPEEPYNQGDNIRLVEPNFTTNQSLVTISRNQQILDNRLKKVDHKLEKVKGFFNKLWDAISCTSTTSTSTSRGKRPAPTFTWTTSEEHTSSSTSGHSSGQGGQTFRQPIGGPVIHDPEGEKEGSYDWDKDA